MPSDSVTALDQASAASPASASDAAGAARSRPTVPHIPGEAGIWIFIFGDMSLYIALAVSFMADRRKQVEAFTSSANHLHIDFGAINAVLLLISSLLVALGVQAVRRNIPKYGEWMFAGAFVCGAGFVLNKYFEYSSLVRAGITPTTNIFYSYYFMLTGIHLTHLIAGMCVLAYMYRAAKRNPAPTTAIESGASFWHAVDLLWMILFALLYLVR
ncbi:cytochrome c oxidase subunit 3 [Nocardia terrae]|nr:cytochrome c oxidase subunit 3 [Nocardia terrae]